MTKKNKVLVIDDESGNRGLIKLALEMKFPELKVEEYENGLGVPEKIKNFPEKYLTVIVDYWMKGITGAEVIREIKRVDSDFPVVLVSGSDADSMREQCPQADFVL